MSRQCAKACPALKFLSHVIVAGCLGLALTAVSAEGWAQSIYIDPQDSKEIIQTQPPFISETLLSLNELPKNSLNHQSVQLNNQSFSYLSLSPDGKKIAFSVLGVLHGWSGIFSLKNKDIQQLTVCFEGETAAPHWSEDGRYLAVEEKQARNTRFIELFDIQQGDHCRLDGRAAHNKFLNFLEPWWSREGDKLFFKVQYNNVYRKSVGLKPKKYSSRIGEADLQCNKIKFYSVPEFMKKFPDVPQNEIISQSEEKLKQ